MDIEFMTNDYLLAWSLLFKPSISSDVQALKEKIWKNHPKEYMSLEKEKVEILKYTSDFIPDNDIIYNQIFSTDVFKGIKKEVDKHRQFLMKYWDTNMKKIKANVKELLKFDLKEKYRIIVVHPKFDMVEFLKLNPKKNIAWGRPDDEEDGLKTLIKILFTVVKYEIGDYQRENAEMVSAIIDLTISNELYTRLAEETRYEEGLKKLRLLKKQLYPYFLMYMGADKEELVSYMMRDKLPFDIDKYPIEKELKKVDLYGLIDFCCRNQRHIIRLTNLDII